MHVPDDLLLLRARYPACWSHAIQAAVQTRTERDTDVRDFSPLNPAAGRTLLKVTPQRLQTCVSLYITSTEPRCFKVSAIAAHRHHICRASPVPLSRPCLPLCFPLPRHVILCSLPKVVLRIIKQRHRPPRLIDCLRKHAKVRPRECAEIARLVQGSRG